jgi:hypothetical protein
MVKQIMSYFLRNPTATDSLEGIAHWRLLEEAVHRNVVATEKALQWLVKEGYLLEIERPRSRTLYRLNPARQKEAESLVDAQGDGGGPPPKDC